MLTDDALMALNVFEEAGGEPDAGKAAIARVVLNRMKHRIHSDGTVAGTILAKDQFSWAWFEMRSGGYVRVCSTLDQAVARCDYLLAHGVQSQAYDKCHDIARQVVSGEYSDPLYDKLTDDAVLYYNPDITPDTPLWATDGKFICIIGRHHFFAA